MRDSAPEKWEYREHTRVKHILLRKYLRVWLTALGKYHKRICYFDGFAGRGEYADGELGSPLIALRLADELNDNFTELVCCFVERDPENYTNLMKVLKREQPKIASWGQKIKVQTEMAEFGKVVTKILDNMNEGAVLIPSFFFIDPFGFSGIPFNLITRMLAKPKTEIFFTFMARDIARFIQLQKLDNTANSLFGTNNFKDVLAVSKRPEVDLMNLYREQLHSLAKVKFSWAFRVCMTEKLQTLYYLIHASNNFKGHNVMKGIMANQDVQGVFAYLGPQDVGESQMKLFDVNSVEELKSLLLDRFSSRTISYDAIQKEICSPWYLEPPYVDSHYRAALRELAEEDKVKITRVTSKTERGLRGEDLVSFPASKVTKQARIQSIESSRVGEAKRNPP